MSAAAIFLGFLNVALYCAVIIFIAFAILWVLEWVGIALSEGMLKFGKIIVFLLCLIVVAGWLLSLLGGGGAYYSPHFFR